MTDWSLSDFSSGFSITRLTDCDRLISSDTSQVCDALQMPLQPIGHTFLTAELHVLVVASDVQLIAVSRSAAACGTSQALASMVNFFSGSVRSKLVTSSLIRPHPASIAPTTTPTPRCRYQNSLSISDLETLDRHCSIAAGRADPQTTRCS